MRKMYTKHAKYTHQGLVHLESITWDCSEEGGKASYITQTWTRCKVAHLLHTFAKGSEVTSAKSY